MRITTGYTPHWHNHYSTFEMCRGQVLKRPWIKKWGWVKKPGFQIDSNGNVCIEHMELPAKLLDYFFWSNKNNINPCTRKLNLYGNSCPHVVHVMSIFVKDLLESRLCALMMGHGEYLMLVSPLLISFFYSLFSKTQTKHWTKQMANTRLDTTGSSWEIETGR